MSNLIYYKNYTPINLDKVTNIKRGNYNEQYGISYTIIFYLGYSIASSVYEEVLKWNFDRESIRDDVFEVIKRDHAIEIKIEDVKNGEGKWE